MWLFNVYTDVYYNPVEQFLWWNEHSSSKDYLTAAITMFLSVLEPMGVRREDLTQREPVRTTHPFTYCELLEGKVGCKKNL